MCVGKSMNKRNTDPLHKKDNDVIIFVYKFVCMTHFLQLNCTFCFKEQTENFQLLYQVDRIKFETLMLSLTTK